MTRFGAGLYARDYPSGQGAPSQDRVWGRVVRAVTGLWGQGRTRRRAVLYVYTKLCAPSHRVWSRVVRAAARLFFLRRASAALRRVVHAARRAKSAGSGRKNICLTRRPPRDVMGQIVQRRQALWSRQKNREI